MTQNAALSPAPGPSPAKSRMLKNAAGAATAAGGGNPPCDFCERVGLPILPLRYAVVPSYLQSAVASPVGWAQLGKHLGPADQSMQAHRHVLRTLRKGYVMVYFGSGLWHAYVSGEDGLLRKLADIDDPDFANDREMSAQCKRAGHNVPASFIHVPVLSQGRKRMLPPTVWLAFSDVLWTRATRKKYEGTGGNSRANRDTRMQRFSVDSLGLQADTLADAFQLGHDETDCHKRLNRLVWEYADDAAQGEARTHYDAIDPYDAKKRNRMKWESAHQSRMRCGEASILGARMLKLRTPSNGQQLMASAVVLRDPLGVVQEVNATRLQQVESRQRYLANERIARPLLISQSIVGLKQFIGDQVKAAVQEEEKGQPDVQTETVYAPDDLPRFSEHLTYTTTRDERTQARFTPLWESLKEHYREDDRAAFEKSVASTLADFQKWFVWCDADYAHRWGQDDWVLRRHDFDPDVREQQEALIEAFAAANAGGPTNDPSNDTPQSRAEDVKTYETWVKYLEMSPGDEINPVYVALFGNRKEFLDYLLPDGAVPFDEHIDKGSKLYKAIKTALAEDLTNDTWSGVRDGGLTGVLDRKAQNKVPNPIRGKGAEAMNAVRKSFIPKATGAVAHAMLALGGALSRLAANAVGTAYRATALRAIQGAVMLYERREIIMVTSRIKVREYLAMLNDLGFDAADKVLSSASTAIKSVAKQGTRTVRSMAVAGALFISDPKIKEAFIEVMGFTYDNLDAVTQEMEAVPERLAAARSAHAAAQAGEAAQNAIAAAAMRVHPFTLSPGAKQFVETVVAKANALRIGSASIMKSFTRHALRIGSTGTGILAVGSLVVQGWSLKDNIVKADKTFLGNNEARVLVIAGSIATIGAGFELVGAAGKLAAAQWATRIGRIGGVLGAAASIVEGIQAGMAAARTDGHGDNDARNLYIAASVALIGGGALGGYAAITGAALLGPLGWALILIAAGVVTLYFAAKAEDTQAGIWLDRCYWGKGERFGNASNSADRPWTNDEVEDEIKQLNAIILGLRGETGFNDDGWGFTSFTWDTVKAKLTFPYFNERYAAYEWSLRAVGKNGGRSITLARGKFGEIPDDPNAQAEQRSRRVLPKPRHFTAKS
jgi:hypothetical protein